MKGSGRQTHGYGHHVDRAINAIITTSPKLVGDTAQARELILALCDQAGATNEAQRAIAALLSPSLLCPNCESDRHARCCSQCGKFHKPERLHYEHCSAKCAREAESADQLSAAMEDPS